MAMSSKGTFLQVNIPRVRLLSRLSQVSEKKKMVREWGGWGGGAR